MLGLSDSTNAVLRHVYTALGTAVALLLYIGVSPDEQVKIVAAVHQIGDGFASIIGGLAVLVPIVTALYARWTAKPAQQIAAVEAAGHVVVPLSDDAPGAPPAVSAKLSSHWIVGALGIVLLLALGACTITGSDGVAIVVTPANFVDVVVAKVKSECPVIRAVASTAVMVTPTVASIVNKADAGKTAVQVEQAAADACTAITATTLPAASLSSSVAPVVTLPAVTVTAPADAVAPLAAGGE
jgi:hypothetical protein